MTVTTSVGKKPASPALLSTRDLAASNTSAACDVTASSAEDRTEWLIYTTPSVSRKSMSAQKGAMIFEELLKYGSHAGYGGDSSDINPLM